MLKDNQRRLLEILHRAVSNGEFMSMQDMAGKIGVDSPNTALYHLRKLEKQGLIVRDVNGKVIRVNYPDENQAIAFLPLLGSARCGPPIDDVIDESTIRMIPIPLRLLGRNTKKQLYLVKAVGESMMPKIEDGDIVIFEANSPPAIGNIIVARTENGFTIKKFKETSMQYILQPYNSKFEPLVYEKNQNGKTFNIDGVAVGLFKPQENLGGGK